MSLGRTNRLIGGVHMKKNMFEIFLLNLHEDEREKIYKLKFWLCISTNHIELVYSYVKIAKKHVKSVSFLMRNNKRKWKKKSFMWIMKNEEFFSLFIFKFTVNRKWTESYRESKIVKLSCSSWKKKE